MLVIVYSALHHALRDDYIVTIRHFKDLIDKYRQSNDDLEHILF